MTPLLLLTCLVLTAVGTDGLGWYSRAYEQQMEKRSVQEPYIASYEKVCCGDVMNKLIDVMSNALCTNLVDTFVNTSEDNTYLYEPTRVKVKKCGGMCKTKHACVSTGHKTIKLPVKRINLSTKQEDCAYAVIKVDTGCMCKCVTRREHCSKKQMYDENTCQCVCDDMEKKKGDCDLHGNTWVGKDCECKCKNGEKTCSFGRKWDEYKCTCMPNKSSRGH